jgi:hypothetical protein
MSDGRVLRGAQWTRIARAARIEAVGVGEDTVARYGVADFVFDPAVSQG